MSLQFNQYRIASKRMLVLIGAVVEMIQLSAVTETPLRIMRLKVVESCQPPSKEVVLGHDQSSFVIHHYHHHQRH
jgi:hypothetical protein